jgi:hypothetical protein
LFFSKDDVVDDWEQASYGSDDVLDNNQPSNTLPNQEDSKKEEVTLLRTITLFLDDY